MASSNLGVGLFSRHQVFVNFRGDELRTGFISFLTDALKENGVKYFVDELENRGEDLNNLFKRIEESSIALVILSKRYSESKWCLDELVKIEEQVEKGQLVAIPIFYKVETSDVKGLEQEFGNKFKVLAWEWKRDQLRVKNWENALLSISRKMGLTLKENGNERLFIRSIIEEVKKVLTEISSKEIETKKKELHPSKNIVLVGRIGNGKSATGNSILGQKVFDSKRQSRGVTMECKSVKCVTSTGRILNVIDTPGLCDMSVSADFVTKEFINCLGLADGGIHAVLLVLSLNNRISEEEEKVLSTLQILFGAKICDYLIVVFSAGDFLEEDGVTLDEYLGNYCPAFLKRILSLCGNRKIVFDNRTYDEEKKTKQVHDLLELIYLVGKQNKDKPYTDEMYNQIKKSNGLAHQKENDRHEKEEAKLKSKGFSEELLLAYMKELQITNEQNLKAIAEPPAKKDLKDDPLENALRNFLKGIFPNFDRGCKLPRVYRERAPFPLPENIFLVGRTGNGKSATGNSIIGQKWFDSKRRVGGVTMECQSWRCVTPNGRILNVVDTPGLFDMVVSKRIINCLALAEGGLTAVLLVLSLSNQISVEEEIVFSTLQILFGSKICDYLILVFTAGDLLEDDDITLDEYLGPQLPKFLKRVFTLCGNRKIVFDNRTYDKVKKEKQVQDFLNLIDQVKKQTSNIPYTDEMYYYMK